MSGSILCRDCAFISVRGGYSYCSHQSSVVQRGNSYVDGSPLPDATRRAQDARSNTASGFCGPAGQFFQQALRRQQ